MILAYFHINKNTLLPTYASDYRAGTVLFQKDKDGTRRIILAAIHSFTKLKYATIER